jgi:thiol:disulfide interchange protein
MAKSHSSRQGKSSILLRLLSVVALITMWACRAAASETDPFDLDVSIDTRNGDRIVALAVGIPEGHFLYADEFSVEAEGAELAPLETPSAITITDPFTGEPKQAYTGNLKATWIVTGDPEDATLVVEYQGCNDKVCFFPQRKTFPLDAAHSPSEAAANSAGGQANEGDNWEQALDSFDVAGTATGYMGRDAFLGFLESADESSSDSPAMSTALRLANAGPLMLMLLVLVFGAALNLTPCVLPLIPVNLAIIGAGARVQGEAGEGALLSARYTAQAWPPPLGCLAWELC